ncbi:sensor histidine kinase [Agromyces sp. CFH 90414]|uniref:Oxygen sensor histidine kinase NreB n=1 Tax=Agromyces agglutinans TaxID=2662258 RepID=A0A6I2F6R7_9MICO|nr:sensor histidine kinase [Agromyces agglutinans]
MEASGSSLERREQQLERLLALVPYVLLGCSTLLALLTGQQPWPERLVTVGIAALAAVWMWAMSARRTPGSVYVVGLIVLIGVLSARDPWFASFFGFTGYIHSWRYLPGIWRFVGVAATATISITAFMGGLPEPRPDAIVTYVLFIVAMVALVGVFSFLGDVTLERSTERTRMVARLEETIRENEGLHAQLLVQAREAGVTDERQRLAREIHDTLAQGFTGIVTQLQAAVRADEAGDAELRRRHVDHAARLARDGLAEARRSVQAIGPTQLESAHLPEAIATVAAEWSELTGVPVEVVTTGTAEPMHPETEVTLLRIAQEALANVAKHANATRVGLTLSYMDDVVTLDVRDDGVGFDAAGAADVAGGSPGGGFGLTSMRQRATRLGGTFEVESEPGGGTAIAAGVPAVRRKEPSA